jgi:hypothetical protein
MRRATRLSTISEVTIRVAKTLGCVLLVVEPHPSFAIRTDQNQACLPIPPHRISGKGKRGSFSLFRYDAKHRTGTKPALFYNHYITKCMYKVSHYYLYFPGLHRDRISRVEPATEGLVCKASLCVRCSTARVILTRRSAASAGKRPSPLRTQGTPGPSSTVAPVRCSRRWTSRRSAGTPPAGWRDRPVTV